MAAAAAVAAAAAISRQPWRATSSEPNRRAATQPIGLRADRVQHQRATLR